MSAQGGGLSSKTVVRANPYIRLPDSVLLKVGALVEPLTIAWHAIRLSGFKEGHTALVFRAGPTGLAILVLLRVWDASTVLVSEITQLRARQAKSTVADLVFNPIEEN